MIAIADLSSRAGLQMMFLILFVFAILGMQFFANVK